jgi:hypothetical protein
MKKIFLYGVFSFAIPLIVSAHVKWFAVARGTERSYSISDKWVLVWIGISVLAVLIGKYLDKKIYPTESLKSFFKKVGPLAKTICRIGFGVSLVLFSIYGFIFAPNFVEDSSLGNIMLIIQAFSGALILLNVFLKTASVLLSGVYLLSFFIFGFETIDALEIFGFSLYFFMEGKSGLILGWLKERSVAVLRVFVGLNLIILGFTEKILNPALTESFLATHKWNFMQSYGFEWFSDYWFAFSAGAMESLIGLLFGILTRLTTLALAGFLLTTLYLLGPVELIGHLPHFSAAVVFLVFGSEKK